MASDKGARTEAPKAMTGTHLGILYGYRTLLVENVIFLIKR